MKFAQVRFERGENIVSNSRCVEHKRPNEPGYWAEYWPKQGQGSSPVWVGPFVSESDALASALNEAVFKKIVYNPLPLLKLQEVYHRDSNTPFGVMGAGEDIEEWASWGKAFASVEKRDEWLKKAEFVVSEDIEGLPVEWERL